MNKSILTDAMENARNKMSDTKGEKVVPDSEEVRAKRLLKKAGIALLATTAAVIAVGVIANRADKDETTEDNNNA